MYKRYKYVVSIYGGGGGVLVVIAKVDMTRAAGSRASDGARSMYIHSLAVNVSTHHYQSGRRLSSGLSLQHV